MGTAVEFKQQDVYGRILFYPVNQTARIIVELTGKKTLTPSQLEIVKELGYRIFIDKGMYK